MCIILFIPILFIFFIMSKKVAVITGGTRGIGKSISKSLSTDGYNVISCFNGNVEKAELFHKETGIHIEKFDVSDYKECSDAMDRIKEKYGTISILVNNAGITKDGFLHKMSIDNWNSVIQTNLSSCFNMTRSVISDMRAQKFGRIINIASVNGLKGQMGQTNYCAAKAGVIGFTKALSLENAAKGITANVIAPGYTETDMVSSIEKSILDHIIQGIPAKRLASPDEVAHVVKFLAHENSGYITGETININGGQYLS
jgi:acetoacetyl-CoA reductase